MSKKILKTIILTAIALIALYIPICYAAGASISTSTINAKPGDTIELYIDLSTSSIGYDLEISTDNDDLISSSEVVSKIGSGTASRIYLVQLTGSEDRITHPSGTRIATIKYTITETATVGSTITLNVAGDVAGETSADKNEMDESITINIVAADAGDDDEIGGDGELGGEEENPPQEEGNTSQGHEQGNLSQEKNEEKQENQVDDTIAKESIPNAGIKGFAILTTIILIVIMSNSLKKYKKNKDIK